MGTQAERRLSTRKRLLDAASACRVESGYAALTTTAVATKSSQRRHETPPRRGVR